MKLSGCTGQPGTLTIGRPPADAEVPAEVVGQAHAAGRVAGHRVDAAVGGAGADGDDGPGLRREPVDPPVERDRLAGGLVVAERRPVALAVDLLVRDRALDHEHERERQPRRARPRRNGVRNSSPPSVVGEHLVVQVDLRQPGDGAEQDVLDARLPGRRHRDRVTVAAHPLRDPEDVDLLDSGHWAPLPSSTRPRAAPPRGPALRRGSPQPWQASGKPSNSVYVPHARQRPAAGTTSSCSSAPSAGVPSDTRVKAKASASGTTWRRWPTLTSMVSIRRSPAWASAICRMASAIESSCISRSSAAGRRPARPSPACRRRRWRRGPCRAARS